ncbi:ferric reductase like protein [Jejuia pallidilutea]|uniref:Ferric reductase like protein n=1 Tax=Jejuia pallidilutea TaxID=504487 RepID=A0A362WYZ2_9FLAO|nr:ferric reductase-like transmembrane domain-containing protein [Jejuia pallidilutea]PQV47801.1 ferric reductase like protein [Jejuia pallidilutea]
MKTQNYIIKLSVLIFSFLIVPLLLYFTGNFQRRSTLMETLSITTILGFSLLLSQFFTSRLNIGLVKKIRMVNVLAIHRFIGYFFIAVILLHPFFIIVPKFFDNGVSPSDAFVKLITTFSTTGIILGIIGYTLMLLLMVTAYFRFKMHLNYKTWRRLHGYSALLFVIAATWHVIDMGRHSNTLFSTYYVLMVVIGVFYLLKTYVTNTGKHENKT